MRTSNYGQADHEGGGILSEDILDIFACNYNRFSLFQYDFEVAYSAGNSFFNSRDSCAKEERLGPREKARREGVRRKGKRKDRKPKEGAIKE